MIELKNVEYIYKDSENVDNKALEDINIKIGDNEFVGIVGHTGSGKSTLIQLLNGLIEPTKGEVLFNGENINTKEYDKILLKFKIGLVFQYPEYQLFESTIIKDVMFGPRNKGLSMEDAEKKANQALEQIEFPKEKYKKSPFELSGGEKKKAAIAGVLAMEPEVLVLDEPTAGLDPEGRKNLYKILTKLKEEKNITIIVVSHSMDDMAEYAKRLIVMKQGKVILDGEAKNVFSNHKIIEDAGLDIPEISKILFALNARGINVDTSIIKKEEAIKCLEKLL